MAGLDVVICDADPDLTRRHLDRLGGEAEDFERQALFAPGSADLVRKNLRTADSVIEAVDGADLIEEAVLERPDVKGPVLQCVEAAARPDAVIGSNTSMQKGRYGVKQGGGLVTPAGDQAPLISYRNTPYARLGQLLKELGPAPL